MNIGLQTYALVLSFLITPAAVLAQCSDFLLDDFLPSQQRDVGLVQRGLRTAFDDPNPQLGDGRWGRYTRHRLVDLCNAYPLPAGVDPVSGTLQMAEEYGDLARWARLWFTQTRSEGFARGLLPAEGELLNPQILALAGPPRLTAQILTENAALPSCDKMKGVGLAPLAQTGVAALSAIAPDRWPDAAAICTDLALTDETITALTSFGRFETELPGSLAQMMTRDFASWLGEAIRTRGPRLAGSDDAVVALVEQFRADACQRTDLTSRVTDYFDFDQAALDMLTAPLDMLTAPADITALLVPIAEMSFHTANDLRRAVSDALEGQISACALAQVLIAVQSEDNLGQQFSLNTERAPELAAIAAAATFTAVKTVGDDSALIDILESLVGTQYPTPRLFDAAIQSLGQADIGTLLPDLLYSAFRQGGDPARLRDWDIASTGCGCYGERDANAAVYGFFPFWLASDLQTYPSVEHTQTSQGIDFGLVNRAAFYGLEFALSNPDDDRAANRVVLHNEIAWTTGQREFVNSAHRHGAEADLAVKISGWANWDQSEIDSVVSEIDRLTQPFNRMEKWNLTEFKTAFPNLLNDAQADGVTLIIDGYSGETPATPEIDKLIGLVEQLGPVLKGRGQTLNIAFDLPLINTESSDPLFADIAGLLAGETPLVNLVLVFLEPPTAESKKKLRARLENGTLQGRDLADLLRRIIPVLPSAGHENTNQGGGANASVPFGQFVDDLVYFQDNFAGVGFWPAPDPSAVETEGLTQRIASEWFRPRLPGTLSGLEKPYGRALLFVSLNRVLISTMTIAFLLLMALGLSRALRPSVK